MRERLIEVGLWPSDDPRDPSESIAAAMQVIDAMKTRGFWFKMVTEWQGGSEVNAGFTEFETVHCGSGWVQATADTAPMAICLAALKAVGVEVTEVRS